MSASFSTRERVYAARDIAEMCSAVVAAGGLFPVQVHGSSMAPVLRNGSAIQLGALSTPVPLGSIVLAHLSTHVVLHRVLWRKGQSLLLAGDACAVVDGWVDQSNLIAMLVTLQSHRGTSFYSTWQRQRDWCIAWLRHKRRSFQL